uniref:Protein HIRA n=1 Tax=Acrobeloides nanus TaxID=290746 RepID=A0A914CAL2_9BILA
MICSVDIHPDGGKMATAGHGANVGSGLLIIWDIKNVWNEGYPTEVRSETEKLASIPFTKCVNCVRWSRAHNGRYLVTGGDEPEVTIWEYKGTFRSEGSIGSNKGPALREKYTAVHKLYGHQMDIIHLEWSHNGWFLATGSLDGKVVIWNARHFPDRIAVLDENCSGHTDSVIGLSWDPIGKYLATFSFDKSVKIWQSDDWKCVKTITEPFADVIHCIWNLGRECSISDVFSNGLVTRWIIFDFARCNE